METQAARTIAATGSPAESAAPEASPATPRRPIGQRLRRPLLFAFPIALALLGGGYYVAEEPYVTTDDAFVRAAKVSINARVAGQVVEIAVEDNQPVHKGQVLFRIDPVPYQIAVDQAAARLGIARLQIEESKATYRQQTAELQSVKETAAFDEREFERKKALLATGFVSRAVYERAETDLKVARQQILSVQQQLAHTIASLNGDPNVEIDRHPSVRESKAQLDRAQLELSYATVLAPEDGIVTKVDELQVGHYVNAGAGVFSLMSTRRLWIEANFRETGLTHMHPGQRATVEIDTYPDHMFKARVASLSPGTGSQFAVLPPENATGNWVKVIQRLPVRLELEEQDPGRPLYSGISVTVRVDTGHRSAWSRPLLAARPVEAAQ